MKCTFLTPPSLQKHFFLSFFSLDRSEIKNRLALTFLATLIADFIKGFRLQFIYYWFIYTGIGSLTWGTVYVSFRFIWSIRFRFRNELCCKVVHYRSMILKKKDYLPLKWYLGPGSKKCGLEIVYNARKK